jgi:preprotein translocase subunit SecE
MFEIYKSGQGKYTRTVTFISAMFLGIMGAYVLSENLGAFLPKLIFDWPPMKIYLQYGIPTVAVVLLGVLMMKIVNRQKSADFLIATESEMKKVSWSSRKEVVGSTKVVIVTAFIMAAILFAVDIIFIFLFKWLGIMKVIS